MAFFDGWQVRYFSICTAPETVTVTCALPPSMGTGAESNEAGAAAMRMNILPRATGFALAVAISITEKSPFRDIPKRYAEINPRSMNDRMIQRLWPQFRSIYS